MADVQQSRWRAEGNNVYTENGDLVATYTDGSAQRVVDDHNAKLAQAPKQAEGGTQGGTQGRTY